MSIPLYPMHLINPSSDVLLHRLCQLVLDSLAQCWADKDIAKAVLVETERERANLSWHGATTVQDEQPLLAKQAIAAVKIAVLKSHLDRKLAGEPFQFFE